MLREVVSSDKGPHMGLQCMEVWIVKRLYCGIFHRSVHSFDLSMDDMAWSVCALCHVDGRPDQRRAQRDDWLGHSCILPAL